MRPIGRALIAAISVIISAVSGILANLITNHWSWTAGAAFLTLILAAAVLAWWDHRAPDTTSTGITQTARGGAHIDHVTIHASNDGAVQQHADHNATIRNVRLRADGAPIHQRADDATIADTDLTATD